MTFYQLLEHHYEKKKKLSVNVFSMEVLIEKTIFTTPTGDGTAILGSHLSHSKV